MNKEKIIEYLELAIRTNNRVLSEMKKEVKNDVLVPNKEYHESAMFKTSVQLKSYETLLNLLQLPQRTIETLEVGDYVEFMDMDDEKQSVIIQIGEALGYLNMYFNHCRATKIKIIPHEAIELLKEVIE